MTFRSDPARPGSDAWAMLDDEGARILGPRFVLLRQHMLIIRRWTQRNWRTNRPSSYSQPKKGSSGIAVGPLTMVVGRAAADKGRRG